MDITKLLPALPIWVAAPLLAITVIATLWPQILQAIRDVSSWDRQYRREKLELELLKLRYEIEALRKEKGLEELPTRPEAAELVPNNQQNVEARLTLRTRSRFFYGVAGALLPIAMNLLLLDIQVIDHFTLIALLGYSIRVAFLLLLAGGTSVLVARGQSTRATCFLVGLSVALFLSSLLVLLNMRYVMSTPQSVS